MHERPVYVPASHVGRPGPVNRGLAGTGRVGDDLWLVGHDDRTGRPQLPRRHLGLGLAAGLLAELMLGPPALTSDGAHPAASTGHQWRAAGGSICLRHGYVMITGGARRAEPEESLSGRVRGLIAGEPDPYPVIDWLRLLARTAAQDIAERLAGDGYLARARPMLPWHPPRYVPADSDAAFAAIGRVRAALDPAGPYSAREVTLAGLADATRLNHRLDHDLSPARDTIGHALALLPPDLYELVRQTRAAVDRIVLAHRT